MKRRIFTGSNSLMRGQMLAPKAGFFCANLEGYFTPTYWRPAFTEPLFEEATPAQVDCLTAVFGGPLFCLPKNVKQSNHAHRNSHTSGTRHPLQKARLGAPSPVGPSTTRTQATGVRSGEYFSLRAPGVHLPGMQKNKFSYLREKVSDESGGLIRRAQIGGQKHSHSLRTYRKRAGRLHCLIN